MTDAGLQKGTARALGLVTAYRIVSRAYFHLPIVTVFLLANGFPVLYIAVVLAVYGAVAAVADAPLAPLRRRVTFAGALAIGEIVKAVALLLLVLPLNPVAVMVSQVLAGVGFSLTAGTDAALASSLRRQGRAGADESRVQMAMFVASFAAGVLGALSLLVWDRLPFVLSAVVAATGAALAAATRLGLRARARRRDEPLGGTAAGRAVRPPRAVRIWGLSYSLNRALLLSAYTFLIPLLLLERLRLSLPLFGVVLGVYTLLGLGAARLAPRVAGTAALFWVSALSLVAGLTLLLPARLWLAVVALGLLGVAGGFVRPATMIVLAPWLEAADVLARQRVLRGLERYQGLLQAVLLIASGAWLAGTGDIVATLACYAGVAVVMQSTAAVGFIRRIGRKPFRRHRGPHGFHVREPGGL